MPTRLRPESLHHRKAHAFLPDFLPFAGDGGFDRLAEVVRVRAGLGGAAWLRAGVGDTAAAGAGDGAMATSVSMASADSELATWPAPPSSRDQARRTTRRASSPALPPRTNRERMPYRWHCKAFLSFLVSGFLWPRTAPESIRLLSGRPGGLAVEDVERSTRSLTSPA